MSKGNLSIVEKHFIRRMAIFFIVQLIMLLTFVYCFVHSQPINVNNVKTINIVVEDTRIRYHARSSNQLFLYSGSERFLLTEPATQEELTATELYDRVSIGDKLRISYVEIWLLLYGKTNLVVEAQSDAEVYRALNSYNLNKHGISNFIIIVGILIEIVCIGIVIVYVCLNKKTARQIGKKIKRLHHKS